MIRRMNGFTLIEILISLIVLAIGLLGIAAMQTSGVRANHSAYLRSQASVLAYEIIDRMRANRDRNTEKLKHLKNYVIAFDVEIKNPPDCTTKAACSEIQLIQSDLNEWKNSLKNLPEGTGSIAIDIENDTVIAEVIIKWNDTRNSDSSTTFTTQTRL